MHLPPMAALPRLGGSTLFTPHSGTYVSTCDWEISSKRLEIASSRGELARNALPALQARDWHGGQVRSGLHVCANSGREAAPKIDRTADLLLSAVRRVTGDGHAAGGCSQYGRMGHDSGSGERGAFAQRSGLGESARDRGPVDLGPGRSVGNQASPNRIKSNSPLFSGARRTSGPATCFSLSVFFLRSRGRGSPGPQASSFLARGPSAGMS